MGKKRRKHNRKKKVHCGYFNGVKNGFKRKKRLGIIVRGGKKNYFNKFMKTC